MGALLVIRRRNAIRKMSFFLGLALGTGAFGQVRNDLLYNDIVDGQIAELRLSLDAGTQPNAQVFVPGADRAIGLLELSVLAKNDNAAVQLLQVGAMIDSLEERFGSSSILAVLAQQGMVLTLDNYIDQDVGVLVGVGSDPLLAAIGSGQIPAAQLLLDRMRAVVGQDQLRPSLNEALVFAARSNDKVATQMLLARGADVSSGLPLVAAVANCATETVETLLSDEAVDPNSYYEGDHIASYALRCFQSGNNEDPARRFAQVIHLLHEAGSSICPVLAGTRADESSEVEAVLLDLGLCQ